jgi:Leucine-rich repeat (LRR) protein
MDLYGTLPTENGLLTSLRVLDLEDNRITGTIPKELCMLRNLTYMNLGNNQFRLSIPSCFGQLTKLQSIHLHKNDLSSPIPNSISNLQHLQHFIVSDNLLSGDPSMVWNALNQLEVLFANKNMFLASIDDTFLRNHTQLQWLDISDNDFVLAKRHNLPKHFLQMSSLEVLDLSQNRFDGGLPTSLEGNTMLQYLSLYDNTFDGEFHILTNLRALRHLDLSQNAFYGTLHQDFSQLTDLQLLFAGDNDYDTSQTIPTSFVNLTKLEDFSMRNSLLSGPLDLIHLPKSLIYLDVGSNDVSGSISDEIGQFTNLEFLILNNNNNLGGSIPTTINQLSSLRVTFLDGTSIVSGVDQICTLPNFKDDNTVRNKGVVAYADCDVEVQCNCCRCCNDHETNGNGCSISYQINLRKDWSIDFHLLDFTNTNNTVFLNRTDIPN